MHGVVFYVPKQAGETKEMKVNLKMLEYKNDVKDFSELSYTYFLIFILFNSHYFLVEFVKLMQSLAPVTYLGTDLN